jgi:hypothetical protein
MLTLVLTTSLPVASAHTRVRKSFLQDLEACADLAAVRALCESETIVEAWAPAVSAEE